MNKSKAYTGIDVFRLIAAFLVVAIHTSPLTTYSETGDFILTRIAARVAVPFFLMTSGFFLISRYARDNGRLISFLKKMAIIYGISIVVCLPLNLYNGYFGMEHFLPNLIKDIVFDGTLYHLWYLPASILGGAIAWMLVRKLGVGKAFVAAVILYCVGLFGDSYYGVIEGNIFLRQVYDCLFEVSDYTRNGIFLAPVFFVMGGMLADRKAEGKPRGNLGPWVTAALVFFLLMFGEAMLLHHFDLQRHDSMYLFLLPCMYCLFQALLFFRGDRIVQLRSISLVVYIVHPIVIVGVRLAARILGMWELLVENSLIHYLAVAILSGAFSAIFVWTVTLCRKKVLPHFMPSLRVDGSMAAFGNGNTDRAWIEVDLEHLRHNVKVLKRAMPEGCELMAIVKTEGYGHGAYEMAVCANRIGVRAFGVATIDEGIVLRKSGVVGEILILGYVNPARAKELSRYRLTATLISYEHAVLLGRQGYRIKAHLKVDTGMHRLGFGADETERIAEAFSLKHVKVEGIYTHLCVADSLEESDVAFSRQQIDQFYKLLGRLEERGITIPKTHMQSSYGLWNYPELRCDYVRAGIALYGALSSAKDVTKLELDLQPVLSLKSRVVLLREIKKGESVGYGRTFVADKNSRIAIVPIGYGDGFPRNLSGGKSSVLIRGQRVPVVGRICMDQLAVDVTDISEVQLGDVATFIGADGEERILAADVADDAESITNELLSRMGRRLKVVAKP